MRFQRLAVRTQPEAEPGPARRAGVPEPSGGTATAAGFLLRLQRSHGNRYVQRLLQPSAPGPAVQAKLLLGPVGDRFEQEADRLAEDLPGGDAGASERGHRPLPAGAGVARRGGAGGGGVVDPGIQRLILAARGQGRPLPPGARRRYERYLGADFGAVRLHNGQRADELNLRLRSSAFTVGNDIFFRSGELDTASDTGGELLGHELVHVVQQAGDGSALLQRGRAKQPRGGRGRGTGRGRGGGRGGRGRDSDDEQSEPEESGTSATKAPAGSRKRAAPDSGVQPPKKLRTSAEDEPAIEAPATATQPDPTKTGEDKPDATMADVTAKPHLADIPVGYLDRAGMTDFLTKEGLSTDKAPSPISVGVVVWNINHLKAEDDEDVDDADAKDTPDKPAPSAKAYDSDAIRSSVAALRNILQDAAKPVKDAVDTVIAGLDQKSEQEPATGTGAAAKKYRKELSATRKEVSQLKRDIEVLLEGDFDQAIANGIAAMNDQAKEQGTAPPVEKRADQLERIRSLNRVWKRLARLRAVLETGKPRLDEKIQARDTVRGAVTADLRGRIVGNIDKLLRLLPAGDLETAVSSLKRGTVVDLTTRTFFDNPAVNLVLINEMNLGIGQLAAVAGQSESRLGLSTGPIMLAKGQALEKGKGTSAKGKASVMVGTGDDKQQVLGKQYEYYPAMHRAGGAHGLSRAGTFYVSTSGRFAVQGEEGQNSAIPWDKSNKEFRGIVVHRYTQGGQEFWAGVLHTTPAGKDLERKNIWPQIKAPLTELNQIARHFRIPLLVGGDFYIPAEGIVNAPDQAQKEEIRVADQDLLNTVKLAHLARNAYLAAVTDDATEPEKWPLKSFIAEVGTVEPPKQERKPRAKKAASTETTSAPETTETPQTPETMQTEQTETPAKTSGGGRGGRGRGRGRGGGGRKAARKPGIQSPAGITKRKPLNVREQLARPEQREHWARYRRAVTDKVAKHVVRGKTFQAAKAIQWLAPGRDYKDVTWSDTLGAGTIGETDIIRNYQRPPGSTLAGPEPRITMQRALDEIGYQIVPGGSPTNPKSSGRGENKMQLADLFLVNEYWKTARSGLVTPGQAKLKPVDDAALSATQTYWKISDHSPVLMLGSTADDDTSTYQRFDVVPATGVKSVQANQHAWDTIGKKTAGLATVAGKPTVAEQIDEIKKLLVNPLAGPEKKVNSAVRERALALKASIEQAAGFKPTPDQQAVLAQIAEWQPFYTTDFSEDDEATPSATGVPATLTLSAISGPGRLAADVRPAAPAAWPTGEVTHVTNSCYLAAVIHVLASAPAFRDLLTNATHTPPAGAGRAFQHFSQLHALVATLRNPDGKITADQMSALMRYLDNLPGLLVPDPQDATQQTTTKETSKEQVSEKAANEADKATKAGKAYGVQQDAAEILLKIINLLGPPGNVQASIESTFSRPGSGPPTTTAEDHAVITLPLGTASHPVASIADALRKYAEPELVADMTATKQLRFGTLPEVLTLALSRFSWSEAEGRPEKITRWVAADDPLTIPDECLSRTLKASLGGRPARYQLVQFVHHSGWTARSGHYRSYGRLPGDDAWYEHDDLGLPARRRALGLAEKLAAQFTGYIYVYVRRP
ncbi:MAG TPA: DUF4157 domain-containing protein [Streptosporangiaceae bacterium]|jgi:hypothetical protein